MNPSISVIIPNYNRADLLPRAIDSVLSQSLAADEIIVVDDGSSDDSCRLVETRYPHVQLIRQAQQGVSSARNKGIGIARGEWLAFLDSDDEWLPEKLEKQLARLNAKDKPLVIHTNETWLRNGEPLKQLAKHRKYGGHIYQRCLPLCLMSPSSIMVHSQLFSELGVFDESLPVCEDYDMWLRICSRYPVAFLEQNLIIKHGGHDDQLSKKYWGMDRFRVLSLAKNLKELTLSPEDRQATIDMLLLKIKIYLGGARKHGNLEMVDYFESLQAQYLPAETAAILV